VPEAVFVTEDGEKVIVPETAAVLFADSVRLVEETEVISVGFAALPCTPDPVIRCPTKTPTVESSVIELLPEEPVPVREICVAPHRSFDGGPLGEVLEIKPTANPGTESLLRSRNANSMFIRSVFALEPS